MQVRQNVTKGIINVLDTVATAISTRKEVDTADSILSLPEVTIMAGKMSQASAKNKTVDFGAGLPSVHLPGNLELGDDSALDVDSTVISSGFVFYK